MWSLSQIAHRQQSIILLSNDHFAIKDLVSGAAAVNEQETFTCVLKSCARFHVIEKHPSTDQWVWSTDQNFNTIMSNWGGMSKAVRGL